MDQGLFHFNPVGALICAPTQGAVARSIPELLKVIAHLPVVAFVKIACALGSSPGFIFKGRSQQGAAFLYAQ